jgi:hypothetical protein
MIKKLNDFEKNMLLMAGSAGVGMLYSYVLYNNVHNNAFSVASILGLFFLGAFILSFSIRLVAKKNLEKKTQGKSSSNNLHKNSSNTEKDTASDTKKGFYYGKKDKDKK